VRSGREPWARIEGLLVLAISLHSAAIGVAAIVATEWGLRFSGFEDASPLFFTRQVGVFHIVVAIAYCIELFRYRGIVILLTTKAIAVVFLGGILLLEPLPWIVPFSAVGDGAMAGVLWYVHRRAHSADSAPG
jgi:hypothetical protein